MDITFLGGAGEVGRSAFLLKDSVNMLFDCGVKLDGKTEYPMEPGKVDLCLLSHAHLDHSGSMPSLYNYSLPVAFGTEPSKRLSELLINDAIKLAHRKHEKPRFFRNQFNTFLNKYIAYPYKERFGFGEYDVELHDAGHICGSAITSVERNRDGKRIAYTGDFKLERQTLHDGADIVKADALIIESTYFEKDHPERKEAVKKLVDEIKEVVDSNGTALMPVFAVGRSQEVMAVLAENGLADIAYLDGMARQATDIVLQHRGFLKRPELLEDAVRRARGVSFAFEKRQALEGGSIIVTTSGMLNGGPVLNYLTRLNRSSKIFLTGYQVEGTNGRRLLEGKPLIIDNKKVNIVTPMSFHDLSAHAGRSDLLRYVKESGPEKVFCVHGERKASEGMAAALREDGFDAYAPKNGDTIGLGF
ncbi:MAG: MBL fold metallo-hydrolase [Candidatus Micrarchaeota archaeon]|nr:MBL fold metallo-hydrolase [Candidatus Micrarchaeota archaeon]